MAPSPTGYFHVGSARTALFNWLFARQQGGTYVLRIEDTDALRNRAEHAEGIERAMLWLGLDWDEGPNFQSERGELYEAAIDHLLAKDLVYACDCNGGQVAQRNQAAGRPPVYDGYCRDRGLEPAQGRLLRFRTPDTGTTSWPDIVRGEVVYENSSIEDFSIRKSNGQPLFILANVADDGDMAISHVIRGEDHVPNTPKYLLLWEALELGTPPLFAHLPLLVNESRQKLSKRRDKVALEDYRDEGYLPEAMFNYLALLGWSPRDDREILSKKELVEEFRLENVKSSPAFFDQQKLASINATYIRAFSPDEFVARAGEWLTGRWAPIAPLVQERAGLWLRSIRWSISSTPPRSRSTRRTGTRPAANNRLSWPSSARQKLGTRSVTGKRRPSGRRPWRQAPPSALVLSARRRRRSGWQSRAAAWGHRCSNLSSCWAGAAPWPGSRPPGCGPRSRTGVRRTEPRQVS